MNTITPHQQPTAKGMSSPKTGNRLEERIGPEVRQYNQSFSCLSLIFMSVTDIQVPCWSPFQFKDLFWGDQRKTKDLGEFGHKLSLADHCVELNLYRTELVCSAGSTSLPAPPIGNFVGRGDVCQYL